MDDAALHITKLDAAKRQLQTAIRLWFADDDPVAIHTLAAAAHELVHVLFRTSGQSGLLFDSKIVREERRSEVNKRIKSTASFFKHANRDRDATLDFHPFLNEMLILFSLSGLARMGENAGFEGAAFSWWHWVHNPQLFSESGGIDRIPVELFEKLRGIGKIDFLEEVRHLRIGNATL